MDRDSAPQEITTLVGREVYTNNGVYIGQVEDLRLELNAEEVTGLALHELNSDVFGPEATSARGVIVPYRWVQAVGDVIIVNDIVERIQRQKGEDEGEDEDESEVTA
jgi:sporulation protein YlmC with PRC-barrel domain